MLLSYSIWLLKLTQEKFPGRGKTSYQWMTSVGVLEWFCGSQWQSDAFGNFTWLWCHLFSDLCLWRSSLEKHLPTGGWSTLLLKVLRDFSSDCLDLQFCILFFFFFKWSLHCFCFFKLLEFIWKFGFSEHGHEGKVIRQLLRGSFRTRLRGFKSQLCHFLAVWIYGSYFVPQLSHL